MLSFINKSVGLKRLLLVASSQQVGNSLCWDLTVLGWEVSYKEEFVPTDEGSYTVIVQKGKKMGSQEGPVRNTFRNNEPGKVVLTIENTSNKKKKVLYRYKSIKSSFWEHNSEVLFLLNCVFSCVKTEKQELFFHCYWYTIFFSRNEIDWKFIHFICANNVSNLLILLM